MPIIAKTGGDFTPAPAGTHAAVCVDVIDLGVIEVNYQGKVKAWTTASRSWCGAGTRAACIKKPLCGGISKVGVVGRSLIKSCKASTWKTCFRPAV